MKLLVYSLLVLVTTQFLKNKNERDIDCSKFKTGTFYFRGETDTSLFRVERNDSIQIETLLRTGDNITLKISWVGTCDYNLSFISQHIFLTDSIITSFQGMKLNNTIKKVQGDSCFIEGRFENGDINQIFKGVLYIAK